MKRKRRIATRKVYKWKSRLNLGGHKQVEGKHYDQTYAPALEWATIRLFLLLSIIKRWHTRQIDFVLAYPQAPVPRPTFMELPVGINFPNGVNRKEHCLEILQNIYGGKDSGRTWYLYLRGKLIDQLGFIPSKFDECVFYRGTTILLVYTDDCILIDKESQSNIDNLLKEMQAEFDIEDEGNLEDYLGVHVTRNKDGTILLSQPHLIQSILEDLQLIGPHQKSPPKAKDMPALTTKLIGPDFQGQPFNFPWDYRSVIGKLNFLEKSTRPDIAYATHQCARFLANPKKSHGEAVKHIGRYFLGTKDKGLILKPGNESFECYVDADFMGNWDKTIAAEDPNTAKSRYGFVVKYCEVPLYWQSKLQTMIALSTAESEYIGLSHAARYVKSTIYLLQEINERVTKVITTPTFHCKLFEDKSAALEIAKVPKMRPRTRHINCVYHHFRQEVSNGIIKILPIDTKFQQADVLTKAVDLVTFLRHRKSIMGW